MPFSHSSWLNSFFFVSTLRAGRRAFTRPCCSSSAYTPYPAQRAQRHAFHMSVDEAALQTDNYIPPIASREGAGVCMKSYSKGYVILDPPTASRYGLACKPQDASVAAKVRSRGIASVTAGPA